MRETTLQRCAQIPYGNYMKLLSAVNQQPVSVAIELTAEMMRYSDGVFTGDCTS
jgi:hypothetical protein